MYSELNEKIYALKEKLRIKEKLGSSKDILKMELKEKEEDIKKLKNILDKEKRDVTKLESMSINAIFLNLIGKKEDQLDKEKEEYAIAKLKYEESLIGLSELKEEIKYYNNELEEFYGIENDYEKLVKEKEKLILNEDNVYSRTLRDYQDQRNNLKLEQKELKEAIDSGKDSISSLSLMRDYLNKAKSWGVWDMMGGGLVSNIAKHSAIDEANKSGQKVTQNLKRFKKELSDVDKFTDMDVDISSFAKFADFFFDGFFVDWFVQTKINDSLSNVSNAESVIDGILSDLKSKLREIENEQIKLDLEIKNILES